MTPAKPAANHASGFSLIMVSIILTVASLLLVAFLQGQDAGNYNNKTLNSITKLQRTEDALKSYMLFNGHMPCPADGAYGVDDANFGVEAPNGGNCTGGTPAASMGPDATTNVVAGVIPTKTLQLPDDYALDEWGRRFTYVVDKRATAKSSCLALMGAHFTGHGGIEIHDATGGVLDNVMHAFISHGPDGHGAFPPQGSPVGGRINAHSTDADTQKNASVDAAFALNFTNIFVRKEKTATFDDILYYNESYKNTCCVGSSTCVHTGLIVDGENSNDQSGWSVASGDINGDGIADLIIGAPQANGSAGYVYVVFGTRAGFPSPLPLNTLTGTNGFRLEGELPSDKAGFSVAAGDFNKDGFDDIIIGASGTTADQGSFYVVFGKASGWPATRSLATGGGNLIDGVQGFRIDDIAVEQLGSSLAMGDINGDGYKDIIAGAPFANASAGYVYVLFGRAGAWAAVTPATTGGGMTFDGSQGFRLDGEAPNDALGGPMAVASGNINGDAYDDIVMGAPGGGGTGYVYTVMGHTGAWAPSNVLTTPGLIIDGSNGFRLEGDAGGVGAGTAVAVGKINGDSFADLVIGVPGENTQGAVDVVYGKATAWLPTEAMTTGVGNLIDGTKGYRLDAVAGDEAGISVAAGDIDNDGLGDVIIGGRNALAQAGETFVVFGKSTPWTPVSTLVIGAGNLIDGTQGFRVDGAASNDKMGSAVWKGDINGDGITDVISGSPFHSTDTGQSYVIFGQQHGHAWPDSSNASTLQ